MKALVLTAPRRLEIRDVPVPDIGDDEVLVRVRACTVCHTDLDIFAGVRQWDGGPPNLFGHEVTGIVEAAGSAVTHIAPGDRVLLRMTRTGFAEYCKTKGSHAVVLPPSIGFEEGAIAQLLPIAIRGVEKSVRTGDTMFISGAGPAGMLCAQVARAYGASRVIVADLHDLRLRRVIDLAANVGINAATEDVVRRVREESNGRGADVCIECAGVEASFRNCEQGVRNGGSLVVFGTHLKPVILDLLDWESRSLSLIIAREQPDETPELLRKAVEFVEAGVILLRPLLTHVFPLHRAQEAFDLLLTDPARAVKVAILP
ncbi:MAG: alcohol dehydrogenase catalytic domain-containing protein [Candidatus Latescibacteria bacterium]|nr:alcohol dehydrogenase catalytic domain-containing protein [Candidatus Latescibacterota bacterium]